MDKSNFKIEKNEKLIAVLEKKKNTITNNYYDSDGNLLKQNPQTIMTKPVKENAVPRDGQVLVYDGENKEWIAGTVDSMRGVAVFVQTTEPIDMQINDIWIQI